MDNPKIIKIESGTPIANKTETGHLLKSQNFIVISETETHFFFDYHGKRHNVQKQLVKDVTYKNRTLRFSDLKKDEILNIFDNYEKLLYKARDITKEISKYDIKSTDMTPYQLNELMIVVDKTEISFWKKYPKYDEIGSLITKVPLKYLWDKNWKATVKRDYDH